MCFNAACAIGLRPLLHDFRQLFQRYARLRDQSTKHAPPNQDARRETPTSHQLSPMPPPQDIYATADTNTAPHLNGVVISAAGQFDLAPLIERQPQPAANQIRVDTRFEVTSV